MGSLSAVEEDDAAKRHNRPPPPSPQQQLLLHQEYRAHETIINGTTWYHQPPSLPHYNSDSHVSLASPARYGSFAPSNTVNFDGTLSSRPPLHRQPPYPYNNNGAAFGNGGIRPFPPGHVIPPSMGGCPPGYVPDCSQGVAMHAPVDGGFPGQPYPGMGSMYGPMPGYTYNGQQNQGMAYYAYDGHARPYMPPPKVYMITEIPNPNLSQGPPPAPQSGFMMNYTSHGMPPLPIRTAGKTLRTIVAWSGMTMPVTITSQAAAVVEWIQRQTGDLFGFDLEWKPNRLKDEDNLVALLQICGPTDCLIIQLHYTDTIPRLLRDFLSNSCKLFGGVGIRQDVQKLERDHNLVCQGQVELGTLASEKLRRFDLQGRGLKKLVDQVLGMTLVKVKKITMSNWEKEDLDVKQIEYACIDAWAAYAILHKLMAL